MGLSVINPDRNTIRVFGRESGFDSDIRNNAVGLTEGGKIIFGSSGGVIQYDAHQAREDTVAPRLNIKSILISGTSYDPGVDIKLKYGKYSITLKYRLSTHNHNRRGAYFGTD